MYISFLFYTTISCLLYLILATLGLVAAPFAFIAGVHTSYLDHIDKSVCEETCKIYLDEGRIDFGALGTAPPLPDRRAKKLYNEIILAGHIYENRGSNWIRDRLPYFEDAFSGVSDRPPPPSSYTTSIYMSTTTTTTSHNNTNNSTNDNSNYSNSNMNIYAYKIDAEIRSAFLNFFVGILKTYRRHLIYGNAVEKFQSEAYISGEYS